MTTDLTARSWLILASVLGFALTAATAQAQTQPAASAPDKGAKRAKPAQPVAVQGANQPVIKTDTAEPDMIQLQEPFRSGATTPVSVTRSN